MRTWTDRGLWSWSETVCGIIHSLGYTLLKEKYPVALSDISSRRHFKLVRNSPLSGICLEK